MLRNLVYPKVEPVLNRAAAFLAGKKITPNQMTLAGMVLNALAGWAYSGGLFALGALILLAGSLGDLLDGPLARHTGRVSRFGAFLDSTVDRYSDFFVFGGLAWHFANQGMWSSFLMTLGVLLGAYATSYTRARGESLVPAVSVGLFERPERVILLFIGSLATPLLPLILGILLVGTHVTALQRIFLVKRLLQEKA